MLPTSTSSSTTMHCKWTQRVTHIDLKGLQFTEIKAASKGWPVSQYKTFTRLMSLKYNLNC